MNSLPPSRVKVSCDLFYSMVFENSDCSIFYRFGTGEAPASWNLVVSIGIF
jgi:hypothetical protein